MPSNAKCHFSSAFLPIFSSAVLTAISLAGCSSLGEEESETLRDTDDHGSVSMVDASIPQSVPDASADAVSNARDAGGATLSPPAIFIAAVRPSGTGCSEGDTEVSISPDAKKLLVRFTAFEAAVDKNKSVAIKDCQLSIKLKSPQGMSFGITEFSTLGYAYLEKGQTARQFTRYYFQGQPAAIQREARADLVGPFDDTYIFQDTVESADTLWSPCNTVQDLTINLTLRLQNASEKKDGYINLSTVSALHFATWRRCSW